MSLPPMSGRFEAARIAILVSASQRFEHSSAAPGNTVRGCPGVRFVRSDLCEKIACLPGCRASLVSGFGEALRAGPSGRSGRQREWLAFRLRCTAAGHAANAAGAS